MHAYLEHIALVSTGVNFGICRAAVCLVSVQRGAKLQGAYGIYHIQRTVTYSHFCVIACRYSKKYAKGH